MDKKNGIKYTYKEEILIEKPKEKEKYDKIEIETKETIKDALDLFGQDLVQIQ